jgi:transposase-like protein
MKSQRQYDREFKINAVKLYKESGKTFVNQALDLGIPMTTLVT